MAEHKFVTLAANVETTRDQGARRLSGHYPALHGAVSCLHFRPDGIEREVLEVNAAELESRMAICYTGEPRLSGTNNWEIFKRHISMAISHSFRCLRASAILPS